MTYSIAPSRFEKTDDDKCRNNEYLKNWKDVPTPKIHAEFLTRIWAHYGAPHYVNYEGFTYCMLDNQIGVVFSVYSAGSGPAFAGEYRKYDHTKGLIVLEDKLEKLEVTVQAFEKLLDETKPADCEIQFDTDFGMYRAGAKNGVVFEEPVENN